MHDTHACACAVRNSNHAPELYPVHEVLAGKHWATLSAAETALFRVTATWLDESISQPNPALGRSGDVCPWTRRTLQLGRLFLASVPATASVCIDASVLHLLRAFHALQQTGPLDTFRAIVAVFPRLSPLTADKLIVDAHARLKPSFLQQRMMLGEFFPGCDKPGLHATDFRPLRSPHPLLVIRAMVEADLPFLTDRDEFVDAYLNAFGAQGQQRLRELLQEPGDRVPPDRVSALRERATATRPSKT